MSSTKKGDNSHIWVKHDAVTKVLLANKENGGALKLHSFWKKKSYGKHVIFFLPFGVRSCLPLPMSWLPYMLITFTRCNKWGCTPLMWGACNNHQLSCQVGLIILHHDANLLLIILNTFLYLYYNIVSFSIWYKILKNIKWFQL